MTHNAVDTEVHLDPSDLGTKEYWDVYYQNDLDHRDSDENGDLAVSELESWFDDVGAPEKTLAFLTSDLFPLAPNASTPLDPPPSVLDIGTGNGSALISLRLEGKYHGVMVGVDYSETSIQLARKLWSQAARSTPNRETVQTSEAITFDVLDVIRDDAKTASWWPVKEGGFDLVLDKGTFDAVSLSPESIEQPDGTQRRLSEIYPERIVELVKPGGFFLITSCNWTHDEVVRRFTMNSAQGVQGVLEVYHSIEYPVYEFGGQKGQGVVSICFHRP